MKPHNFQLTASAGFNGHKQFTFTVLIVLINHFLFNFLHLTKQINRAIFINDDWEAIGYVYFIFASQLQAPLGNSWPQGSLSQKAEEGTSQEEMARQWPSAGRASVRGSCWQLPFSDLSAKSPPSCSPGRRGQVSGYWDGKGLRQVGVAYVDSLGDSMRQARSDMQMTVHPTFLLSQNPVISWSYNFFPLNSSFGEALCLTGEHEETLKELLTTQIFLFKK